MHLSKKSSKGIASRSPSFPPQLSPPVVAVLKRQDSTLRWVSPSVEWAMRTDETASVSQILVWIIAGYASAMAVLTWMLSDFVAFNAGLSLAAGLLVWRAVLFRKQRTIAVVGAVLVGIVVAWQLVVLLVAVEVFEQFRSRKNHKVRM